MKYIITLLLSFGIVFGSFGTALADQYVNGYYKSNGTYVNGYWRSSPDGNPYNNFSFPGNTNPYTGVTAGGNASTYLNNYYNSSSGFSLPTYRSSYTLPSYTPTYTPSYTPSYGSSYTSYTPSYSGYSGLSSDDIYKEIKGGWQSYGVTYCDSGYYEKNDKCVKEPSNGYALGGKIYCDSGYLEKGGKCEKPKNGELIGSTLYCDDGFFVSKNSCVTLERICKAEFGSKSVPYGEDQCTCKEGFKWNTKQTECVKDRSKTSSKKSSS
jgi:hypothetical protein